MDGIGAVMTSSPTSSMSGRPAEEKDSTRAPSARQEISPRQTGTVGAPPTIPVHRSVPPENDTMGTSPPKVADNQSKPLSSSGDPVEPTTRTAAKSRSSAGATPAF